MKTNCFFGRLGVLSGPALLILFTLSTVSRGAPVPAKDLIVGFIYVGAIDDHGYNEASAHGAAAVKKLLGVKVLEAEKIEENDSVQEVMKNMIDKDGAAIIFATSYGYLHPHVVEMAKQYPNVHFFHCGGSSNRVKDSPNVATYFGFIDECQYLSGIVAGHATKSNKLGFVAAKPIPQVRRNINAFLLGARSVNPRAEVHVYYTGDWLDPKKEAEAMEALLKKGCDVFTCHVDDTRVVAQTAAKAGKYVCGFHASAADIAGDKYLTGAEWNWEKVCVDYVNQVKKGEKITKSLRGGLKEGMVKMSPYGKAVSAEAKKAADAAKAKLMDGSLVIFKGPLKDNGGKEVIAQGTQYRSNDPKLEEMDYHVEGVIVPK